MIASGAVSRPSSGGHFPDNDTEVTMSESQGHGHDHDSADGSDAHAHLPGPVRSALGLLADGIDRARNLAGPAGEKARFVTDKVREESADVFDKVRDEGAHVVNKLRRSSGPIDASNPTAGAASSSDERRERAAEAFEIAKTVGAALLVGTVKVVQLAMREWQAHTGNASTPEDNVPSAAWDTAGTPKAPSRSSDRFADAEEAEPQPVPEVNNWDDVEAETATGSPDDSWAADTSGAALRTESAPAHSSHSHERNSHERHSHEGHTHADPPLEGFDEMTIGSLRGRLGSLSADDLESLRQYERDHSARPQVLTMLENRIAKVAAHGTDA